MGPHQKNRVGGVVIFQKSADGTVAQLQSQCRFGGAVAKPGAVVHVVVADDGALKLLGEVGFLVEDLSAAQHADAAGAVPLGDFPQAPGSKLNGLLPGDQFQFLRPADIGLGEALLVADQFMDRKALHTGIAAIQFGVASLRAAFDRAALLVQLQFQVAANPAKGANDWDGRILHNAS